MNKLISVIVPVYNVEKYLDRCVESIVNQTYKNLEIILIDDGATDNSPEMCDEWKKKDNRIKVIHKKNGGLSDARNCGIDTATGDYFAFVDSDDYIDEKMYECLINMIEADSSDISMCSFRKVDEKGCDLSIENTVLNETIDKKLFFERLTTDECGFYVVAWNKLYKSSLFDDLRYDVGKLYEDSFIIHKIIGKCNLISITNKQFCNYLQNTQGITHRKVDVRNLDKFEFSYNRYLFFVEHGYDYLLHDLRQSVVNKYLRIFPELTISGLTEYKRYREIKKMINKIMKGSKREFPIYNKLSIVPPILLKPLLSLKDLVFGK